MLDRLEDLNLLPALANPQAVVCPGLGKELPRHTLQHEPLDLLFHGIKNRCSARDLPGLRIYFFGQEFIFSIYTKESIAATHNSAVLASLRSSNLRCGETAFLSCKIGILADKIGILTDKIAFELGDFTPRITGRGG